MAPKRHRMTSKASARKHQVKLANKRGLQRRAALRSLNALVVEQELPLRHINAKILEAKKPINGAISIGENQGHSEGIRGAFGGIRDQVRAFGFFSIARN